MILRIAKIATAFSIAAFFTLVTFGNLTDYGTNFAFVQHVMAMDTIFATSSIKYRAITDPAVHHAAYGLIIAAQATISALCWAGVFRLVRRVRDDAARFNRSKDLIVVALTLGFLLSRKFAVDFRVSFFVFTIIAVLRFVLLPDSELAHADRVRD